VTNCGPEGGSKRSSRLRVGFAMLFQTCPGKLWAGRAGDRPRHLESGARKVPRVRGWAAGRRDLPVVKGGFAGSNRAARGRVGGGDPLKSVGLHGGAGLMLDWGLGMGKARPRRQPNGRLERCLPGSSWRTARSGSRDWPFRLQIRRRVSATSSIPAERSGGGHRRGDVHALDRLGRPARGAMARGRRGCFAGARREIGRA